jgi:hypothetical protein
VNMGSRNMELTKRERRLLSRRNNAAILWLGVGMVAFAIAVPILALMKWREADAIWQRNLREIESISASGTDAERMLKRRLMATTQSLRELDRERVDETAQKGVVVFGFPGIMGIGLYFRTRTYHRLFERLGSVQEADAPHTST